MEGFAGIAIVHIFFILAILPRFDRTVEDKQESMETERGQKRALGENRPGAAAKCSALVHGVHTIR